MLVAHCTGVPDTESDWSLLTVLRRVLNWVTSDLAGLSDKPLCISQSWMARIQDSIVSAFVLSSDLATEMYSCVLSAYWWWLTPNEVIILDSGAMYKENNAGPRDDPCGTPDYRKIISDKNVPNLTIADRESTQSRYDLIQLNTAAEKPNVCSNRVIRVLWTSIVLHPSRSYEHLLYFLSVHQHYLEYLAFLFSLRHQSVFIGLHSPYENR